MTCNMPVCPCLVACAKILKVEVKFALPTSPTESAGIPQRCIAPIAEYTVLSTGATPPS